MDIVDELREKKTRDNRLLLDKAIIEINALREDNERLKRQNAMLREAKVIYETVDYCSGDVEDLLEENDILKQEIEDLKKKLKDKE